MKHACLAALACLFLAGLPAHAQDSEALYVKSLAATCANCHGTQGRAAAGASVPGLAGRPKDELIGLMKAFKAGSRPATIMHQLSKGYSDAQIESIAGYLATQKP